MVSTPVNWKPGGDVVIPASLSDADAKNRYPQRFATWKSYLHAVPLRH